MLNLSAIQIASIEMAEAITAVLEIETEIVDKKLKFVAGTGRYKEKIGTYEEDGNVIEEEFYGNLLLSGKEVVVKDVRNYPRYHPKENELAEICCPIKLDNCVMEPSLHWLHLVQTSKIKFSPTMKIYCCS